MCCDFSVTRQIYFLGRENRLRFAVVVISPVRRLRATIEGKRNSRGEALANWARLPFFEPTPATLIFSPSGSRSVEGSARPGLISVHKQSSAHPRVLEFIVFWLMSRFTTAELRQFRDTNHCSACVHYSGCALWLSLLLMNEELSAPGLDLLVPDISKPCPMFFPWSSASIRTASPGSLDATNSSKQASGGDAGGFARH